MKFLCLFGLFLLSTTTVYASYNLYLNEHETMRLLGELNLIKFRGFLSHSKKHETT